MSLSIVNIATANSIGSNPSVNKPAGVAEGDMMLLVATTASDVTVTASGWTLVDEYAASAGIHVFYKVAGASEPTSYTVTHSFSWYAHGIIAYSSSTLTDIVVDVYDKQNNTSSSTSHVAPSVTTTRANSILLSCYSIPANTGGTATADAGNGMTERWEIAGGSAVTNYLMDGSVAGTGATGTRTATTTSSYTSKAISVAIAEDISGTQYAGAAALTAVSDTASAALVVQRTDTVTLTADSITPDDVVLLIERIATVTLTASSATTDDVALTVQRVATAILTALSATPDDVLLSLALQAAVTLTASSATPDDVALLVQRTAAAVLTAISSTPDDVVLRLGLGKTANLRAISHTPNNVELAVIRAAAPTLTASSATPDDVALMLTCLSAAILTATSETPDDVALNTYLPYGKLTGSAEVWSLGMHELTEECA